MATEFALDKEIMVLDGENDIMGGRRWKMTGEQFAAFRAFIAEAITARDGGPRT